MNSDVFVVGGGPAGLAAAIALRLKGFGVTVADGARFPIDKACGEGLMPDAVAALRALGIEPADGRGAIFRGIDFIDGATRAQARFGAGTALGLRRTILHRMLAERAAQLGVRIRWETPVERVRPGSVEVGGSVVHCRWIVGADGQASRVRRSAGLERCRREGVRFGFRRHFRVEPWTDFVEVHWGADCQFFVTPVDSSIVAVALLSRDPRLRIEHALARFPSLERRLTGAPASPERGAISAMRQLKRVARDPYILVGDAAGSVDAVTGEGLAIGFQCATALAEALVRQDLAGYEAAHARIESRPALMARLLLFLDRHSSARRAAVRALAASPGLFSWLLDLHVRRQPIINPCGIETAARRHESSGASTAHDDFAHWVQFQPRETR
jgi:flavin-dependent dehydrogenase